MTHRVDCTGTASPPTSPERREMSSRSVKIALFAVLAAALGLRLWGIGFGLPYDFTPDEIHEIVRALKLGAGEYNLQAFTKGGLYLILFVEYGFLFAVWWLMGQVTGPTDFALAYLQDPTAFYLLGRVTVALMGVATCLVVFEIGKRAHDWRVGLGAAVIGATAYYHGLWSHYINVDTGMVLCIWSSILAYMEHERRGHLRWLIVSGSLAGAAIAFKLPGAIGLLPLTLAAVTPWNKWSQPRVMIRRLGIGLLALLVTLAILSPGTFAGLRVIPHFFSGFQASEYPVDDPPQSFDVDTAIDDITVFRVGNYLNILLRDTYVILTLGALLGAVIGCIRKHRWDIIWCAVVAAFLLVMYAADRPGNERYLLPVMPAFWLLAASGVVVVARGRGAVMAVLFAGIVVVPLHALMYQNYMWTRPDTRVLAKEWIEANVPDGARILMDGMKYRFIQSPPLNPDEATVARRVDQAEVEGSDLSRGVSTRALDLYSKAMTLVSGPRYDLHSTVWGLDVRDLSYYLEACFDYIVTSSVNSHRFAGPSEAAAYPHSATFYRSLPTDPRFEVVYSAVPATWKIQGPIITVYKVKHSCR